MKREWPHPEKLDLWISPEYFNSFSKGRLREDFVSQDPFPHCSMGKFFREEVFEDIHNYALSSDVNHFYKTNEPSEKITQVNFCAVDELELVRFLYGQSFKKFLAQLCGKPIYRAQDGYPQIRKITHGNSGFDVHTDEDSGLDLACFFTLNRDWTPDKGGELCLWRKMEESNSQQLYFQKIREIVPVDNQLNVLFFSTRSHHSVSAVKEDWNRMNIIMELNFEPQDNSVSR